MPDRDGQGRPGTASAKTVMSEDVATTSDGGQSVRPRDRDGQGRLERASNDQGGPVTARDGQ